MIAAAAGAAPTLVRAWVGAINDVWDLYERIKDRREDRRELLEARSVRRAARRARLEQLELTAIEAAIESEETFDDIRDFRTSPGLARFVQRELDAALQDPDAAAQALETSLEAHNPTQAYKRIQRRLRSSKRRSSTLRSSSGSRSLILR